MTNQALTSDLQIRLATINDIPVIQHIVYETWPVAYATILANEQLQYMLNLIYSTKALTQQLNQGQQFYLASNQNDTIGFAAFSHLEADIYKLHKLYVLPHIQKSGAGKKLLQTVQSEVKKLGGKKLHLNVNRANTALTFYQLHGFKIISEDDIDIGEGYFMNDYIMEKILN